MNMNISNITLSKILIINKDENHGKYKELHNIISDYDYNKYNYYYCMYPRFIIRL